MEHAIGTRITLEVVEQKDDSCKGCFFDDTYRGCFDCEIFDCMAAFRTDHKNIIYKEVK